MVNKGIGSKFQEKGVFSKSYEIFFEGPLKYKLSHSSPDVICG